MYIGTQDLLKQYDAYLLEQGYQIEELVNLASDALLNHFTKYNRFAAFSSNVGYKSPPAKL